MASIIENAVLLALKGHAGQTRKDDKETPYVVHPYMVALLLREHGFSDAVIAAALCHDVLEDTPIPADELRAAIGEEAFSIVEAVTNDDALSWKEKKLKYIETVRNGPEGAKAVALADKIHNGESLLEAHAELGSALWTRFNTGREEKLWFEEAMLSMLKETWSHPLIERYEALIEKMRALS